MWFSSTWIKEDSQKASKILLERSKKYQLRHLIILKNVIKTTLRHYCQQRRVDKIERVTHPKTNFWTRAHLFSSVPESPICVEQHKLPLKKQDNSLPTRDSPSPPEARNFIQQLLRTSCSHWIQLTREEGVGGISEIKTIYRAWWWLHCNRRDSPLYKKREMLYNENNQDFEWLMTITVLDRFFSHSKLRLDIRA